jgi:acyl dehydratase
VRYLGGRFLADEQAFRPGLVETPAVRATRMSDTRCAIKTALNLDVVGTPRSSERITWNDRDSLLYALAIGAGHEQLSYSTENSIGVGHQVYPTFASALSSNLGESPLAGLGDVDLSTVVQAEQSVVQLQVIPATGSVDQMTSVVEILAKGTFALVVTEASGAIAGEPLYATRASWAVRGAGGWGGSRGEKADRPQLPARPPDVRCSFQTTPDQALLYRLTGDRHPLHSDPTFARHAGFDQPILHGQCTFGIVGRLLSEEFCGGRSAQFKELVAQLRGPVVPGERITVDAWSIEGGNVRFTASVGDRLVLDQGRFVFEPDA